MKTWTHGFLLALVVGLGGLAVSGCGSGSHDQNKMGGDKMGDKMTDDKMGGDKMSGDKMSGDKMSGDKMSGDKMSDKDKMPDAGGK